MSGTGRDWLDDAQEAVYRGERSRAEAILGELPGTGEPRRMALEAALRYFVGGDGAGALASLAPALRAPDQDPVGRAAVDLFACWILACEDPRVRRVSEALSRGHRARHVLAELGDQTGRLLSEVALGAAYLAEGEPELASEMWASAIDLATAPSFWRAIAQGGLASLEGRPVGAVNAYRQAVEASERTEFTFLRASLLVSLAEKLEDAGERTETAVGAARRAAEALRAIGSPAFPTTARAFRVLGDLLMRAGMWDEARDVLTEALRQAESAGEPMGGDGGPPGISALRESLGTLALRRGDLEDARLHASRAHPHGTSDPRAGIPGDRLGARIASVSGDAASALALHTRVRDAAGPKAPAVTIEAELGRAAAAIASGDVDMARRAVDAATVLLDPVYRPRLHTEFDHVRGKLLAALGRHEEAVVSLERARVSHHAAGDRYEASCVELDIAAHAATTGARADVQRIGASADVLTSFGSPFGPRLRALARTLAARPGSGSQPVTAALPLELLGTPAASAERILRTIFQIVCDRLGSATVLMAEREGRGVRRLFDRRGEAVQEDLDDYEIRDRSGRRFLLSIQREPGRESPWLGTLLASAELALEAAALRAVGPATRARAGLPDELAASGQVRPERFAAVAFGPALGLLARVRSSRRPVLLLGEPGTGKRSLAHAVHVLQNAGPLVEIDCAALDELTAEALLSGPRKASAGRRGLVREADGGTLLLLGVEELRPGVQQQVQRLLATGEVRPTGVRTGIAVDVRVVATCRGDLWELTDAGGFDRDLHDRLAAFPLRLSPLRDRPEVIVSLARRFLGDLVPSRDALIALLGHPWPGNITELRGVLRIAAKSARQGERTVVEAADLTALHPRRPRARVRRSRTEV